MKLYHYTATSMGEAILSSGITDGHLMHSDNSLTHNVVWLTTDPRPDGHGLTLGNEKLDSSAIAYQERLAGGPIRNTRTLNKTELRFGVELDPEVSPWLLSFMGFVSVRPRPSGNRTTV